MHNKGEKENI